MKTVKWEFLHDVPESEKPVTNTPEGFAEMDMSGFGSFVFTPLGTFHERDPMNPNTHFEFWIGHTNFRLNPVDIDLIRFTNGVDMFHVWTPYRFIIAFGKNFKSWAVKLDIEAVLSNSGDMDMLSEDDNITVESFMLQKQTESDGDTELQDFYSKLDTVYKYWVVCTEQSEDELLCTYYACNSDNNKDFKDTIETLLDAYEVKKSSDSIRNNEYYHIESDL